ncbi:MAG: DEAD/DEAH box helicase [Rickettsiales bacterium]|nr:DEAD/DEAH box helicase [Rickettsiales bacterium]
MTFKNLQLHPKILQAIDSCGYDKPTQIQAKAIPAILDGKDMLASAQTGTGKTAAYVLPALQFLTTKKHTGRSRILILSPTRELAIQIAKVISRYAKFLQVNVVSIVGGIPYKKQLKELSRAIDIIIATPGRLLDHTKSKRLDLSGVEMLILDEADRMLDMGFIKPIKNIVQEISYKRQTLLFSATAENKLMSVVKNLLKNPVRINISPKKTDIKLIKQEIHLVRDSFQKKKVLENLLKDKNIDKAIIFSATKRNVKKLATQICLYGHNAGEIHGDLKQNARNKILTRFRTGKIKFLVATDVASRGIDVADVSHVINYDLPKFSEDYVHRIGRTGRAGKKGTAISVALHSEKQYLRDIERYIGQKLLRIN